MKRILEEMEKLRKQPTGVEIIGGILGMMLRTAVKVAVGSAVAIGMWHWIG